MFRIFSLFLLPLYCFSSESIRESFDLSNFHGAPSAIVGGHVNVITGDFIDYEIDCVLPGPHPIIFDRFYSSSECLRGTLTKGWSMNYNYSARYFREDMEKENNHSRNYFVVADGLGTFLKYRGCHNKNYPEGKYTIEKKLWEKGLTNISQEISGKTNVKNHEARISNVDGCLTIGNGDKLHFESVMYELNNTKKPIEGVGYLPTKKVKLNRTTELYTHEEDGRKEAFIKNDDYTLNSVTFMGQGGDCLGYFKLYHTDKCIRVTTPLHLNAIYYHKAKLRNLGEQAEFIGVVERSFAPDVSYDYDHYVTQHNGKEAARVCRKYYPEGRIVEPHYYHQGKQTVHSKKISIDDPEELRYGRVKRLCKPLGERNAPTTDYEFIYHVHEKNGYLYGHTQVYDAHGSEKRYEFDKSRLLFIKTYEKGNHYYPYREEEFLWGKNDYEGFYLGKKIKGFAFGNYCYFGTSLEYDQYGNVTKETLSGHLTGTLNVAEKGEGWIKPDGVETYSKEKIYTQDKRNLVLEERDFRKKTLFRYIDDTDLLSARFLSDHQKICKREFFFYDANGAKTKEIVDDGSSEDMNVFTDVTERQIIEYVLTTSYPIGLPENTIIKAYDFASGTEKQIKRIKKTYSDQGWVLKEDHFDASDQYAFSKKYTYNQYGKVTYEEDPTAAVTHRSYDANNNLIEERGPLLGFAKVYSYYCSNCLFKEEEFFDGEHLVKSYRYNLKNERIEETDVAGNVSTYAFDELGREISSETPFLSQEGFTTLKTTTGYDILDNPCVTTDPRGNKTCTYFTALKKPFLIEYPDGTSEKIHYALDGTVEKTIDKYGNVTSITSDYQSRPIKIEIHSPSGEKLRQSTKEYTAFHLLKETDPLGCTTEYKYDFAGRLIQKIKGSSLEEYVYDSLSRVSKTILWTSDTDAIVKLMRYDNNDRITEERKESLSGILESQVNYEYNALGKVTKETHLLDEKSAVTLTLYNPRGDVIETITPDGSSTKIFYDYHMIDGWKEKGTRIKTADPKGVVTLIDNNALGLEKRGEKKNAKGVHTVFRRDPVSGSINHYETFRPQTNPFDPKPWESVKRFDGIGKGHTNKILQAEIKTPHTHDPLCPGGIRSAFEWELPRWLK